MHRQSIIFASLLVVIVIVIVNLRIVVFVKVEVEIIILCVGRSVRVHAFFRPGRERPSPDTAGPSSRTAV